MGKKSAAGPKKNRSRAAPSDADQRAALRRRSTTAEQAAARRFAVEMARIAADDKCEEVLVLDLRGLSSVCDYFVIATGTSDRQMRAVADHVEQHARARGEHAFTTAGLDSASWIVLDYVDVVIHLFDARHRRYYELESLWGDAPRVAWDR